MGRIGVVGGRCRVSAPARAAGQLGFEVGLCRFGRSRTRASRFSCAGSAARVPPCDEFGRASAAQPGRVVPSRSEDAAWTPAPSEFVCELAPNRRSRVARALSHGARMETTVLGAASRAVRPHSKLSAAARSHALVRPHSESAYAHAAGAITRVRELASRSVRDAVAQVHEACRCVGNVTTTRVSARQCGLGWDGAPSRPVVGGRGAVRHNRSGSGVGLGPGAVRHKCEREAMRAELRSRLP